jgi:hypothetical protein
LLIIEINLSFIATSITNVFYAHRTPINEVIL